MSIELEHSFEVPVPPDQAWDVLLDVQRVAPCMPGATVESVDGDEVSGRIKVKVGPIALTYTGKATFTERDDAAHSLKIEAAGKETRGAGTASAVVLARLNEDNGQTRVSVHTTLNVTGRPAQFGRGVMAEVSGKIIEKFSANLAGQLAGAGQPEAAASDRQVPDSRMAIPIQELNLPARSVNSLKGEGIDTVGQLVSRSESELLSIRNLGQKSVGEIEQRLGDLGLSLAGRVEAGRAEQPGAGQERPPTVRPRTVRPRTVRPRTVRPRTAQPRTARPPTARPGMARARRHGRATSMPTWGGTSRRTTRSTCSTWPPGPSSSARCPSLPPPSC
jgi:carbon monoxide dehydrogenase subunit G